MFILPKKIQLYSIKKNNPIVLGSRTLSPNRHPKMVMLPDGNRVLEKPSHREKIPYEL